MAVAHYGYLVLKMSSPNDVLKIHGDRDMGVSALEKLQALVASREAAVGPGGGGGVGTDSFELTPALLDLRTPRAALRQRGSPCEDCSDWG
jgi:hypothetical protein